MCVWFFPIDTGAEVYEPEYDCYPSEDRDPCFSADLTGKHSPPATYFAALPLFTLLLSSVSFLSRVLSHVTLQALQPPPLSYICCLVLSGQPCES
jgi:hypothetical protein